MTQTFSDQQRSYIIEQYIAGRSPGSIAPEFGVDPQTIRNRLIEWEVPLRHPSSSAPTGEPRLCSKCKHKFPATGEFFGWRNSEHTELKRICRTCDSLITSSAMRTHRLAHPDIEQQWYLQRRKGDLSQQEINERAREREHLRKAEVQARLQTKEFERAERKARMIRGHSTCSQCNKIEAHPVRRYKGKRYCDNCRAELREKEQRERKKKNRKLYYARHPGARRREKNRHAEKHPGRERWRIWKRAAHSAGRPAEKYSGQWQRALDYWDNCCAYCGRRPMLFDIGQCLHGDHFIPLADPNSPGTVEWNMLPACQECNLDKADKNPYVWVKSKFGNKAKKILTEIESYFTAIRSDIS